MFAYIHNGYVQYLLADKNYSEYDDDFKSHCVECSENTAIGMKFDPLNGEFFNEDFIHIESSEETNENSISDLEIAIAELAEKQELDKQEIETAIAELAETLM